jgi:anti-anti-sigma factor
MSSAANPVLYVKDNDRAVLATVVCRDLELDTTAKLQSELTTALDAAPTRSLVLDLSSVEFVPSLALGLMVKVRKALAQDGRKCVLVGVRPLVRDAMRATALDRFLVLRGTVDEALEAL